MKSAYQWYVPLKDVRIWPDRILLKNPHNPDEQLACRGILSKWLEIVRKRHVARNVAPYNILIEANLDMSLSNMDELVKFFMLLHKPLAGPIPQGHIKEFLNWSRIKFLDKKVEFTDDSGIVIVVDAIRSNAGYNTSMELLEELSYKVEYVDSRPNNLFIPEEAWSILAGPDRTEIHTDWSLIKFLEARIWFSPKGAPGFGWKESRSRDIYDKLKPLYQFRSFEYRVDYRENRIEKITIPDSLWECLDIADLYEALRYKPVTVLWHKYELLASKLDKLSRSGNVHLLKAFFNRDKSFYLIELSRMHADDMPIKVLLEPHKGFGKGGSFDLSFAYVTTGQKRYHLVWESVEPDKATFVMSFESRQDLIEGENAFSRFLLKPDAFQGRDHFRTTGLKQIPPARIERVFHDPHATFDKKWLDRLSFLVSK